MARVTIEVADNELISAKGFQRLIRGYAFKFLDSAHLNSMLNGRLLLSRLSHYRAIESSVAGITDPNEGISIGRVDNFKMEGPVNEEQSQFLKRLGVDAKAGLNISLNMKNSEFNYTAQDNFIFCASLGDFWRLLSLAHANTPPDKKKYDAAVAITEIGSFYFRILMGDVVEGYRAGAGWEQIKFPIRHSLIGVTIAPVMYGDEYKSFDLLTKEHPRHLAFYKANKFRWQCELRFELGFDSATQQRLKPYSSLFVQLPLIAPLPYEVAMRNGVPIAPSAYRRNLWKEVSAHPTTWQATDNRWRRPGIRISPSLTKVGSFFSYPKNAPLD